jgi:ribosome biogenesis GTPase A
LDSRDPEGTRISEVEEYIKEQGKKIIFIINKSDLIPENVAADW